MAQYAAIGKLTLANSAEGVRLSELSCVSSVSTARCLARCAKLSKLS